MKVKPKGTHILGTILELVSYATFMPKNLVVSSSRKRELVIARQIYCYYAKKHTKFTLAVIGSNVGDRDHATVLHAIKEVEKIISKKEKPYYEWAMRVEAMLSGELAGIEDRANRLNKLLESLMHIGSHIDFYETLVALILKDVEYLKAAKDIRDLDSLKTLGLFENLQAMLQEKEAIV